MLVLPLVLGDEHKFNGEHRSREIACAFKIGSGTGPVHVDELMKTLGMPPRCNIKKVTLAKAARRLGISFQIRQGSHTSGIERQKSKVECNAHHHTSPSRRILEPLRIFN